MNNDISYFTYSLALIGAYFIGRKSYSFSKEIYKFFVRRESNLLERYGHNSWVCITGKHTFKNLRTYKWHRQAVCI